MLTPERRAINSDQLERGSAPAHPRIVTKRYGRGLLEALSPAARVVGRWDALVKRVTEFYVR